MRLDTKRLVLQVLYEDSAPMVHEFYSYNRAFLSPWEPSLTPHFYTTAFHNKNLRYELEQMRQGHFLRYWMFLRQDAGMPVGSICFQNITRGAFHSCQLGYKMDQRHTRMGYASEAILAGTGHVFEEGKLHRIEALVQTDNIPSIHLIEKLGFQYEGLAYSAVFIQNGWQDIFRYALVNQDIPPSYYLPG